MPRPPAVADTTATLSDQVFSGLARKARERTEPVHALHVGDTYREPIPVARAEAQRSADTPRLHNYAPVQGEPVLLDAIQEHLEARVGRPTPREWIQVTPGATAGLATVAATLFNPGDEVLLPSPYWPLIRGIIASRGAVPVEVPVNHRLREPGFDPVAALAEAVTPRTVAIYVNTPNNPTGADLPRAAIDGLAELAARHDLWVIADECYDGLWYGEAAPAPLWDHPGLRDRTLACHTLSKNYGLAGARVGFVHGPEAAMRPLRGVQTFLTYCAPRPFQIGGARALREGDDWLAEARADYARAGTLAAEAIGQLPPEGGTFLIFDLAPHLDPEEPAMAFFERALDAGVLLTPGRACGRDFERWARLCFTAVSEADLRDALGRLRPLLRAGGGEKSA